MTPLFKKLNLSTQSPIFILSAPKSFDMELSQLTVPFRRTITKKSSVAFALKFCTTLNEVSSYAAALKDAAQPDALIWLAYPKGSSKKYSCEFNRDTGYHALAELGYEPVRMVAIDEDWSALRFRKVAFIKTMTRSFAITEEGKAKVAATKKKKL